MIASTASTTPARNSWGSTPARAVDIAGEHVLPAGQALRLELLDRDVLGGLPVVLGDPVGDR